MSTTPLVSIITPSFNRATFIEDTIRAVITQTYPHIEYIVIDGASTDETVDILESYAKTGKLHYISEPDKGMYDAINKGLERCRGDIIGYINTDDLYFPWTAQVVVDYFNSHPDVKMIFGDSLVSDIVVNSKKLNIMPTYSERWMRSGGIIPQPTVFFRRSVYEKIGKFQMDVQYLADCEYWLRILNDGFKIKKIHEILAIEVNHIDTIREKYKNVVSDEKKYLQKKYGYNIPFKKIILRIKYFEKEFLNILLSLSNALFNIKDVKLLWNNFTCNYNAKLNYYNYITNKIFRRNESNWIIRNRNE